MAGFVSSAGLAVTLGSVLRACGQRAALLGLVVLVTVSTAESSAAGKKTPFADAHNTIHCNLSCTIHIINLKYAEIWWKRCYQGVVSLINKSYRLYICAVMVSQI